MKVRMKSTFANKVRRGTLWICEKEYSCIDITHHVKWVYILPGDITFVLGKEWAAPIGKVKRRTLVQCYSRDNELYYKPFLDDFFYHFKSLE